MSSRVPTILVDSGCLFREGLARLLANTSFDVVASIDSLEQLGKIGPIPSKEALFITDGGGEPARMADHVRALRDRYPGARVLVLAERYSHPHMTAVVRAGADGYLVKTMGYAAMLKSLELVMLGVPVLPAAVREIVTGATRPGGQLRSGDDLPSGSERTLTQRELEVIQCLVQGESNKAIARKLDLAEATVKVHIKAILRKIRVKNRTQAAIWAMDHEIAANDSHGRDEGREDERIVRLEPPEAPGRKPRD